MLHLFLFGQRIGHVSKLHVSIIAAHLNIGTERRKAIEKSSCKCFSQLQAKVSELKNSLNTEFGLIHELCSFVLSASQKPDLIRATLETLGVYLSWVPLGYILQSNMIEVLLKLFPQPAFRNVALRCLTEVRPYSSYNSVQNICLFYSSSVRISCLISTCRSSRDLIFPVTVPSWATAIAYQCIEAYSIYHSPVGNPISSLISI